jgi:hypothetical protein
LIRQKGFDLKRLSIAQPNNQVWQAVIVQICHRDDVSIAIHHWNIARILKRLCGRNHCGQDKQVREETTIHEGPFWAQIFENPIARIVQVSRSTKTKLVSPAPSIVLASSLHRPNTEASQIAEVHLSDRILQDEGITTLTSNIRPDRQVLTKTSAAQQQHLPSNSHDYPQSTSRYESA